LLGFGISDLPLPRLGIALVALACRIVVSNGTKYTNNPLPRNEIEPITTRSVGSYKYTLNGL